jgi:hypothetical protein
MTPTHSTVREQTGQKNVTQNTSQATRHCSGSGSLLFIKLSKILRNFRKKFNIFSNFRIYYQSDIIFVSVATKMSRLATDPTRFVIIRLPGSGSSNCYYASLNKSRPCKILNMCSKRNTLANTHFVVFYKEHNSTTPFSTTELH